VAGADANPYLVAAAILAGMLYGIENHLEAPEPRTGDAFSASDIPLPTQWPDALEKFRNSSFIKQYFGAKFQRIFVEAKLQEIDEFNKMVTLEEYDAYL
jgi:glutamine synthetase